MKRYSIELIRVPCIYCGACEKLCPEDWALNSKGDLKADLLGSSEEFKEDVIIKEVKEADIIGNNLFAAKACPMKIIQIQDIQDKKRII